MKNKNLWLAVFAISFLPSCDAKQQRATEIKSTEAPQQINHQENAWFKMESGSVKLNDETSPIGYWEQTWSYPILLRGGTAEGRDSVNSAIAQFLASSRCEEAGEGAQAIEVRHVSETIFSMSFEVMWMCSGMPHPDSDSGAKTFNLMTGQLLQLREHLIPEKQAQLDQRVLAALNEKISQKDPDLGCSAAMTWTDYYLTTDEFIFLFLSDEHGASACDVQMGIAKREMASFLRPDSPLK